MTYHKGHSTDRSASEYRHSLRERILREAMEAFTKHCIKAVKMDDIAQRLSVSKRTLYELYDNKEDLLIEGVQADHERMRQDMHDFAASGAGVMDILLHAFGQKMEEINRTNPQFYADVEKYPRLLDYLETHKMADQRQFVEFLERGVREGFFCGGLDLELIANIINAQSRYVMAQQLYRKHSMQGVFLNLIYLSLRGLCTHKGADALDAFLDEMKRQTATKEQ